MQALTHGEKVACADLSADGTVAVTSDTAQVVNVWRVGQGEPLRTIRLPGHDFSCPVAISADGRHVAVAPRAPGTDRLKPTPCVVQVVSVDTGEVVRTVDLEGRPEAMRFLRDGSLAVAPIKRGFHVFPPDGGAPQSFGTKTLSGREILGDDDVLCVDAGGKWHAFGRADKRKPDLVKAWFADCRGNVSIAAKIKGTSIERTEGKSTQTAELPSEIRALAIGNDVVVVACRSEVAIFTLRDLSPVRTVAGSFENVSRMRVASSRAILWGLPQLQGSLLAALVVDLDGSAKTELQHVGQVVALTWLDEHRLVSRDEQGLSIVWDDEGGKAALDAVVTAEHPRAWRVRAGKDAAFAFPVLDALEHGGGVVAVKKGGSLVYAGEGAPVAIASNEGVGGVLTSLDEERFIFHDAGIQLRILEGTPPKRARHDHLSGRVAVARDRSFFVQCFGNVAVVRPATWPSGGAFHCGLGQAASDIALADDDALVAAVGDEVRVVDLTTRDVLAKTVLEKNVRRIALATGSKPHRVGVAFDDGTTARFDLPPYAPPEAIGALISAKWDIPLAPRVVEELDRLSFEKGEVGATLDTPFGVYPLPRYLRELLSYRSRVPPNGSSPKVWADLEAISVFYTNLWKKLRVPEDLQVEDFSAIRFPGTAKVIGVSGSLVWIELATIDGAEERWVVDAETPRGTNAGDPMVSLFHASTGVSEPIAPVSELLYRLAPGVARGTNG